MKFMVAILFTLALIAIVIGLVVKGHEWSRNVEGYLKLAADAPNAEKAEQFIDRALAGIEARGISSGSSALIFHNPDADVGVWLGQLRSAKSVLTDLRGRGAGGLEETNALMKFRETLLDDEENGTIVTCPPHMSVFPNQALWAWLLGVSLVGMLVSWGVAIVTADL